MLTEADKTSVAEATKKHKVSKQIIDAWRMHFGQMEANDVKRLKALEVENCRLKKLLVELDLEIKVVKDINARKQYACKPSAKRSRSLACGVFENGGPAGSAAWPAPA